MTMRALIGRTMNAILRKAGYRIARSNPPSSLEAGLTRLAQRPVAIKTVIDIGASDGRWTDVVRNYYPEAFYFLIEANSFHEAKLKQYRQEHSSVDFVLAAAGSHEGEIFFDSRDPLGGVASPVMQPGYVRIPVTTVDEQVRQRKLQGPFFLKLDTHGFEVPILEGARETLQQTSLLMLETYNFQVQPASLRFDEMCRFMEARGFRPIDLVDPLYRQRDGALWQFDLLFMRSDRPEFQANSWE